MLDPWDVEHEFFSRDIDGERAFHLHVCAAGSTWERRHLAFRDWLRTHPTTQQPTAELKRELAAAHPKDTLSYTEAKTAFIAGIVDGATPTAGQGTAKGTAKEPPRNRKPGLARMASSCIIRGIVRSRTERHAPEGRVRASIRSAPGGPRSTTAA